MKNKLIIFALGLVAIAFLVTYLQDNKKSGLHNANLGEPLKKGLYGEDFDLLTVRNFQNKVQIRKEENVWKILEKDGYPADIGRLSDVLEQINMVKIAAFITDDATKQSELKLLKPEETGKSKEAETGTSLEFTKNGKAVFEIILGKNREKESKNTESQGTSGGMYVRLDSKKEIFLIKESLSWEASPEYWMLKQVVSIQPEQIKSINIQSEEGTIFIAREKENDEFLISEGDKKEKVNKNIVKSLQNSFSSVNIFKAHPLTEATAKDIFTKSRKISLELFDQQVVILILNQPDKKEVENYYLRIMYSSKGSNQVESNKILEYITNQWYFEISRWTVDQWFKKKSDLTTTEEKS